VPELRTATILVAMSSVETPHFLLRNGLAKIGATQDATGWSRDVHAADGGWLVLDRQGCGPPSPRACPIG